MTLKELTKLFPGNTTHELELIVKSRDEIDELTYNVFPIDGAKLIQLGKEDSTKYVIQLSVDYSGRKTIRKTYEEIADK